MSELNEPPDPKILQYLYFQQVQHFKPLAEDIAHYKRAKYLGSPDYSVEWLWEASNRYLLMDGEDYMQESLRRGLNGVSGQAAPATNPTGKGKQVKGEQKGAPNRASSSGPKGSRPKGESRGRSASPGKAREKTRTSVCTPTRRAHAQGGKDCGFAHAKDKSRSSSPNLGAGKGRKHV